MKEQWSLVKTVRIFIILISMSSIDIVIFVRSFFSNSIQFYKAHLTILEFKEKAVARNVTDLM